MNPFDLRGPEFLVFYTLLGAVTLWLAWYLRRAREGDSSRRPLLSDYLQIAYLRGGHYEALRVATMTLINRGLIEVVDGDSLHTADAAAVPPSAKKSERGILEKFRTTGKAVSLFSDPELSAAAVADCRPDLMRLGLLPDDNVTAARTRLLLTALLVLDGVALTKILVALSRGRTNILFLVLESIVFSVILYKVTYPFRTRAGDALLGELETLFAGLRARAGSLTVGAAAQDVELLAAVFGTGALPSEFASDRLFRQAQASGTSCGAACGAVTGSWGADGSSGASSSGSSCGGGGGGGGGCGGGGGGCGGCGS